MAETVAIEEVLAGLRRGLAREGVLGGGEQFPRVVVEVLRVDEVARGVLVDPGGPIAVRSRGAGLAVTARAYVIESLGSRPARDTGDLRRAASYAHTDDPRMDAELRRGAIRDAAAQVGEALARRVLGEPEPALEPL